MTVQEQLAKMRDDWDRRAAENARHYVATARDTWTDDEFFQSGEETVRDYILTDMENICQGRDPSCMRVLEIGCGAGRVTRALARRFGHVYGVDVSGEMIDRARHALADFPNAHVYRNSGQDLDVLPDDVTFDFAFSCIVFQHIPSHDVIRSYILEASRRLTPGSLFKFQLQGADGLPADPADTWLGAAFTEPMARAMADDANFEMRYAHGAGTQDFWLWFFRR
jgi:SAM-dependent methyltransferase